MNAAKMPPAPSRKRSLAESNDPAFKLAGSEQAPRIVLRIVRLQLDALSARLHGGTLAIMPVDGDPMCCCETNCL